MLLLPKRGAVRGLAFSPDGTMLATNSWGSPRIELWDPSRGEIASHFDHTHNVGCLTFTTADPPALAWSDHLGDILVWDMVRNHARHLDDVIPHPYLPPRLAFSPNGRMLAATGISRSTSDLPVFHRPRFGTTLWHWQQGGGHGGFLGNRLGDALAVAFSPDGDAIAFGGMNKSAHLWDLSSMQETALFPHERKLHYLAFCRGGKTLVTASPDGLIRLWDVERNERRGTLRGQTKTVTSLESSPDGRILATGSDDGLVRFWDVETARMLKAYNWDVGAIWSVTFARDGQRAAAGGTNCIVVWDLDD